MMSLTMSFVLQAALAVSGEQTYAAAYNQTAETGRPLVVLIGTDWCPGCRTMKQSIIPQLAKHGGLGKVSFAYVDADQHRELAHQLMRGGSIPQLIMYSKGSAGWNRQQLTGAHSVSETQTFLNRGIEQPVAELSSRE